MSEGAIDVLEILWFVIIAVGLIYGGANLLSAWRERKVMQAAASPFGMTLLTGNLSMVFVRTTAQAALLFAGLFAVADPGHPCAGGEHRFLMDAIEVSMFVAAICLTANSIIGYDMRHRLTHLITVGETSASMNREKEE